MYMTNVIWIIGRRVNNGEIRLRICATFHPRVCTSLNRYPFLFVLLFFSLFQDACYYTRKQNPRKGTLDRFNWLEMMRLLIYYHTLIGWQLFKAANILYHFSSPCLFSLRSNKQIYSYVFSHHFATLSTAVDIFTQHLLSFQSRNTFRNNISTSRVAYSRNVLEKGWLRS